MEAFKSLRIKTPGAALSVRQYAGTGEPIVFLHGGPGMGDYFGSLPELFSPPYRVLSYDQRGCGESSRAGSYHLSEHVQDLDFLRRHLGVEKMHLFGHSWGGLLAQLYAKAHPEHVGSLVLCCSAANTGRKYSMEGRAIEERVISRLKRSLSLGALGAAILMLFPGNLGELCYQGIMKQLYRYYFVRPDKAPKMRDANRISKTRWPETDKTVSATDESYLTQLPLDAPVLIVQGRPDVIRETNAVLVERFPKAQNVWIEEASHFPWIEEPDAFREAVLTFYRNHVTSASSV